MSGEVGLAAALDNFNRFDAAVCDAPATRFLRDAFAGLVFETPGDFAAGLLRGEGLEDFLRDFLDIRLPFVAFGGSIIEIMRVLFERTGGWASVAAPGYGYKQFDAPSVAR